jgi:hypothetical protein
MLGLVGLLIVNCLIETPLGAQSRDVSGSGYEGIIIPADSTAWGPRRFPPSGSSKANAWTPDPSDVVVFEERLPMFLAEMVEDPSKLLDASRRSRQLPLLPQLSANLKTIKRRYFGVRDDHTRVLVVHLLEADGPTWEKWRTGKLAAMTDGACFNAWVEFDLDARRFLSLHCDAFA